MQNINYHRSQLVRLIEHSNSLHHHLADHLPHHVQAAVPLEAHLTDDAGHLVRDPPVSDLRYQPLLQRGYQVYRPIQHFLRGDL